MGKITLRSTSVSDNPELKAPKFNFSQYDSSGNTAYYNNDEIIDFVTDGNSLYVCVVPTVRPTKANLAEQEGFLKLVSQGPQGIQGRPGQDGLAAETPRIDASFDEDQLRIRINGETRALSPSLTGPTWKPVLEDNVLTWELTDDRYMPESIDLMNLRPIQKHPLLLRTNSDNTKLSEEASGPANFIQWKYEGDPYWTNLISISELMNLALAGISIWQATDGKWHFGHREVVKANYISDKNGRKIISNVRLGDVLFDAGEIPIMGGGDENDYGVDIDLIYQKLAEIESNLVKSVSVNGGTHVTPDPEGNVDLTIALGDIVDLTPYVKKSDLATINNQVIYNGGNFNLDGQSVAGLQDIQFRVNSNTNKLEFRKKENGTWGSYSEILSLSSATGGEHVELSISSGNLYISYNGGEPQLVGSVGGGTTPGTGDGVGVDNIAFRVNNGNLQYRISTNGTWGSWTNIELPSSSTGGNGMTESEVKHLIGQILEGILDSAIPEYVKTSGHNYFVRINEVNSLLSNYYTKNEINALLAGGGGPEEITIVSYRTFTIYKWYPVDSNPSTPTLPTSASWDGTSNGLTLVGNTTNWTNSPGNRPNDSARLWLATITLQSDGTSSNDWSGPIDLTAYPGKDGNGIEFIYTLCANETEFNALTTPAAQYQDDRDDDYPSGWTDQPQSIGRYTAADEIVTHHTFTGNEEVLFRIEAASIRTSTNGHWSTYCKPFIWSMWGEDGLDGDGVEYIFFLTDGTNGVVTESNGEYSLNQNNWPDNSWAYEYQAPNSGWTDDPSGVSASVPYEFVSKRNYHMNPETRQGAWSNWSEPALWSIWKQGDRGPEGNAVTVTDQQRYYKASNLSTGVTAPAITADPTLAANGSWLTTSNSIQLDENNPYLWFFERITYSNGNKWQSTPVVIRYFNSAVNVDYQEIQDNVLEAIGDDLDALDERLSKVVDTNGDIVTDGENGLVAVITNYTDSNQKSFADIIADAAAAKINANVGAAIWGPNSQKTLTNVKTELDAVSATATTAATSVVNSAISDARTEWSGADATITSTATKATYVWVGNDGSILEYTTADVENNVSTKTVSGVTYTRTLVANAMSAIKQEADKVSIIVGQNGDVKADIIVDAINETTGGSTVQIDADHIVLNGDAIANAITAKYANVGGGAVVLDANGLQAVGANIEGTITATAGTFGGNNGVKITQNGVTLGSDCSIDWDCVTGNKPSGGSDINSTLVTKINQWSVQSDTIIANNLKAKNIDAEYLTVGGSPISSSNRLNIEFANGSIPNNPDSNTIYFIY